ncbi:MAG TPA: prepilin-type N-terminal cleavage/methylation domain-containing protein [Actinomycetota bacterium]|nr:prepilin-type N-terminal cleavage/methylation domain-containing protein [Actinomycetota bacterium]
MRAPDERGFSMVELLVGIFVFSLVGSGLVSILFSVARSTDSTTSSVRISEEARLGLNRLIRDAREAAWIDLSSTDPAATHDSFTVRVDFNADGAFANPSSATAQGNYEVVTYAYDAASDRITVTAPGVGAETLVRGVDCVRDSNGVCKSSVFSFTSNRLEYDWNQDGVTTLAELNAAACSPNNLTTLDTACNSVLVNGELAVVTNVNVAVELTTAGRSSHYYVEAQLRNRR